MKLPDLTIIDEYIEIPHVFYSEATGKPFSHCIECDKYLLQDGVQYVIEKAIRNYTDYHTSDTIFEYAICLDCYKEVIKSFSETSMKNIETYFDNHVDLVQRRKELLKEDDLTVDRWISTCLFRGTPIQEVPEYQIVCQCDGKNLLYTYSPYMISEDAMNEIVDLLSNKTLGEIEGFMDRYLGYPPEVRDILKGHPVFIL